MWMDTCVEFWAYQMIMAYDIGMRMMLPCLPSRAWTGETLGNYFGM